MRLRIEVLEGYHSVEERVYINSNLAVNFLLDLIVISARMVFIILKRIRKGMLRFFILGFETFRAFDQETYFNGVRSSCGF